MQKEEEEEKKEKLTSQSCANLLSFSTKSGPSAKGEVEHLKRISESESCCSEKAIRPQCENLYGQRENIIFLNKEVKYHQWRINQKVQNYLWHDFFSFLIKDNYPYHDPSNPQTIHRHNLIVFLHQKQLQPHHEWTLIYDIY